jgi:hypothetical protein
MPRKQRFKPSRKPKPIETPAVEGARSTEMREVEAPADPSRPYEREHRTDDMDTGQPMRSISQPAVVEETSG